MVIGRDSVLHPLNIAEAQVRTWTNRLTTVCIRDDRRRIDVSQTGQLRPLVPDVGDVHQQVRRKLRGPPNVALAKRRSRIEAPNRFDRDESATVRECLRLSQTAWFW